jgi:Xaa-Pro aminopeptidase
VILHYESNRRTTKPGDVVVVDIGAEYRGYSADVTRTFPVSGRFSPEQREIYTIVYEAQEAGIGASRPGATMADVNRAAYAVLGTGLARLGLIGSATDNAAIQRFALHGVSHYIGLDVHDAGTNGPMQPGVFFTVEPGIYIPPSPDVDPKWWNIGVRIEDDVMVTDGGPVILSAGAPRRLEDVERLMAEAR